MPKYDVLISGMGPSGLFAAYELAQMGKSVFIVSNRTDYTRVQKIFLNPENREYLRMMLANKNSLEPEDEKFMKLLESQSDVPIKDIENFLKRCLQELIDKGAKVAFVKDATLVKVDLRHGHAAYAKKDAVIKWFSSANLDFKFLICADGANHPTVNLVKEQNNLRGLFNYEHDRDLEKLHPYNVSAYVAIEGLQKHDALEALINISPNYFDVNQNKIFSIQFNLAKTPGTVVKCSFTGELPEEIYSDENIVRRKEKILEYIKNCLLIFLEKNNINIDPKLISINTVKSSQKHGEQKDKVKLILFKTSIAQVDNAAVALDDHLMILIGDNVRTPHYAIGHGLNDAFQHVRKMKELISGDISVADYNLFCEKLGQSATNLSINIIHDKEDFAQWLLLEREQLKHPTKNL